MLELHGIPHEILRPATLAQGVDMARKVSETSRIVAAAGGDGTINAVASGVAGTGCCLGILPVGSGNDIARGLHIPRKLDSSVALLADGYRMLQYGESASIQPPIASIQEMDIGTARLLRFAHVSGGKSHAPCRDLDADGQMDCFFINTLGCGFDGKVALIASGMPPAVGRWKYLIGVMKSLFTYKVSRMTVTADGVTWSGRYLMATVANGPVEGGGIRIAPDADPGDGLFDLVLILDTGVIARIPLLLRVLLRGASGSSKILVQRCREVRIESDRPLIVHCDGEIPGDSAIKNDGTKSGGSTKSGGGADTGKGTNSANLKSVNSNSGSSRESHGGFWGIEAGILSGRLTVLTGLELKRRT